MSIPNQPALPKRAESLADRLRQGQHEALEKVAIEFNDRVFRFFACSHLGEAVAEDLTVDVMGRLVEAFGRFRGDDPQIPAFIFSIARHVRSQHLRAKSRAGIPLDAAHHVAGDNIGLLDQLLANEQANAVLVALKELKPLVRDIFLLRYVEELTMEEISKAVDLPQGTVKSHLHRGKQQLKTVLTDSEGEL